MDEISGLQDRIMQNLVAEVGGAWATTPDNVKAVTFRCARNVAGAQIRSIAGLEIDQENLSGNLAALSSIRVGGTIVLRDALQRAAEKAITDGFNIAKKLFGGLFS